ncbi:MAG: tetratricopeptide repeat protein [Lentimicrobiaceae bacterium]|nr:tetratricopeptide repeat protein [Lentimicrobiaceae bacterium]
MKKSILLLCAFLLLCNQSFNAPVKNENHEQQKLRVCSLVRTAAVFSDMCDYLSAYKYLIDALLICEEHNISSLQPAIYNNLGNIYAQFNKYEIAKTYYLKTINLCEDTLSLDLLFNNLGYVEACLGNTDSAFYFLEKSLQIYKQHKKNDINIVLNSIGSLYQKTQQYDSAYHYFQMSLKESRKEKDTIEEVTILSNLGNLFFETGKIDSALFYINLSNALVKEINDLKTLSDNYLLLSKIEELKGNTKSALKNFKEHANLKDSIFSATIFGDINQLQRLYEISKTNRQIEQLYIDQQIKERTIHYQKNIQFIISSVLLSLCFLILYIYIQKRNLSRAYKILVEKHIKIIELENIATEKQIEEHKSLTLNDEKQNELIERILLIMEDTSIIFDPEFSLAKLAVLLQYNHVSVSQVINNIFKKNFRLFLNEYRIKGAQKLFTAPEAGKYTVESVAHQVGFKSPNAFRHAFKIITGVSPGFYLKSTLEKRAPM